MTDLAKKIPDHLHAALIKCVEASNTMGPDDAITTAVNFLAVNLTTVAAIKKLNRGQTRAFARKQAELIIEMVTENWDYARKNTPPTGSIN